MRRTLIVVQDYESWRGVLVKFLDRTDLQIMVTDDPREALDVMADFRPTSVCIDMLIPGEDRINLSAAARLLPQLCQVAQVTAQPLNLPPAYLADMAITLGVDFIVCLSDWLKVEETVCGIIPPVVSGDQTWQQPRSSTPPLSTAPIGSISWNTIDAEKQVKVAAMPLH